MANVGTSTPAPSVSTLNKGNQLYKTANEDTATQTKESVFSKAWAEVTSKNVNRTHALDVADDILKVTTIPTEIPDNFKPLTAALTKLQQALKTSKETKKETNEEKALRKETLKKEFNEFCRTMLNLLPMHLQSAGSAYLRDILEYSTLIMNITEMDDDKASKMLHDMGFVCNGFVGLFFPPKESIKDPNITQLKNSLLNLMTIGAYYSSDKDLTEKMYRAHNVILICLITVTSKTSGIVGSDLARSEGYISFINHLFKTSVIAGDNLKALMAGAPLPFIAEYALINALKSWVPNYFAKKQMDKTPSLVGEATETADSILLGEAPLQVDSTSSPAFEMDEAINPRNQLYYISVFKPGFKNRLLPFGEVPGHALTHAPETRWEYMQGKESGTRQEIRNSADVVEQNAKNGITAAREADSSKYGWQDYIEQIDNGTFKSPSNYRAVNYINSWAHYRTTGYENNQRELIDRFFDSIENGQQETAIIVDEIISNCHLLYNEDEKLSQKEKGLLYINILKLSELIAKKIFLNETSEHKADMIQYLKHNIAYFASIYARNPKSAKATGAFIADRAWFIFVNSLILKLETDGIVSKVNEKLDGYNFAVKFLAELVIAIPIGGFTIYTVYKKLVSDRLKKYAERKEEEEGSHHANTFTKTRLKEKFEKDIEENKNVIAFLNELNQLQDRKGFTGLINPSTSLSLSSASGYSPTRSPGSANSSELFSPNTLSTPSTSSDIAESKTDSNSKTLFKQTVAQIFEVFALEIQRTLTPGYIAYVLKIEGGNKYTVNYRYISNAKQRENNEYIFPGNDYLVEKSNEKTESLTQTLNAKYADDSTTPSSRKIKVKHGKDEITPILQGEKV